MKHEHKSQTSRKYCNTILSFYIILFILLVGCKEDSPELDPPEVPLAIGSEILRNHFYQARFMDYYEEAWCAGTRGIGMYMLEIWRYKDTLTLEQRSIYDTLNRYYICKREDRPDQQYFIHASAKPGIDTSDPADTICFPNAMRIVAYEDRNQNKSFDEKEAVNQLSFCNGIFPKGAIVIFREELSHNCCSAGGWSIISGQDDNKDTILQDDEIDQTTVRCNEL